MIINTVKAYSPVVKNRLNNEGETKSTPAFKGNILKDMMPPIGKGSEAGNIFKKCAGFFKNIFSSQNNKSVNTASKAFVDVAEEVSDFSKEASTLTYNIEKKLLKPDGKTPISIIDYKYDEAGKLINGICYEADGKTVKSIIKYVYNKAGHPPKEIMYKADGITKLHTDVITNYNPNTGFLIKN